MTRPRGWRGGVVEDVDVDGRYMVARQPGQPVEGDAGVGVLGHLVELVGLAASRGDDLDHDLQVERGQRPLVVRGAVEEGGVVVDLRKPGPVAFVVIRDLAQQPRELPARSVTRMPMVVSPGATFGRVYEKFPAASI